MEARSLKRQSLTVELGPLDEGFVRTAVTIGRMARGAWETSLEQDFEAEVWRVQRELNRPTVRMTRGHGAIGYKEIDGAQKAVGYAYAYEDVYNVWLSGMAVIPEHLGKGVLPALAQAALIAADRKVNKELLDPHNILPPLLEGALDDADNYDFSGADRPLPPKLPDNPRVSDVQLAIITAYPDLAEYDVKNA